MFDPFGPKLIAGIGRRRDTIEDRAIIVKLRRRKADESVEAARLDRLDNRQLQSFCAAWARDNLAALKAADPLVPESLHDRAADNWRPLLAIADLCGFGAEAREAAKTLAGEDTPTESAGVMLLEDIRQIFAERERRPDLVHLPRGLAGRHGGAALAGVAQRETDHVAAARAAPGAVRGDAAHHTIRDQYGQRLPIGLLRRHILALPRGNRLWIRNNVTTL